MREHCAPRHILKSDILWYDCLLASGIGVSRCLVVEVSLDALWYICPLVYSCRRVLANPLGMACPNNSSQCAILENELWRPTDRVHARQSVAPKVPRNPHQRFDPKHVANHKLICIAHQGWWDVGPFCTSKP